MVSVKAFQPQRNHRSTGRRFELLGRCNGLAIYDDYAHHPTEVAAQLAAARGVVPADGRLVVVFQPHLYSRTATFATVADRRLP